MKVSVIICTWNRARYLDEALVEMHQLQIPQGVEWELLIVNNNSNDNTDEVIAKHAQKLPIRRLFEPRAGKSYAANLGISQASGDLILCTDDDVLVSPNWIAEYVSAVRQWPDAAFFGGTIDPAFEVEPPSWITRHLTRKGPYSVLQHGDSVRPFEPGELGPIGANMGLRPAVLKEFAFDDRLGPKESQILPADDGEFFYRVKNAGYRGIWVGSAKVRHRIAAELLTRDYIWEWYSELGRTLVLRGEAAGTKQIFGVPHWVLRKYVSSRIISWVLFPVKGERWVRAYTDAARSWGILQQTRRDAASNKPRPT